jgi:hypothetical protein
MNTKISTTNITNTEIKLIFKKIMNISTQEELSAIITKEEETMRPSPILIQIKEITRHCLIIIWLADKELINST